MTRARADAVTVQSTNIFFIERRRLVDLAAKNRLPTMYLSREFVDAGGLMSYAPNVLDLFRRAATYVDKILKGAKPGDLPRRAADEVRACDQPQDRQGAWAHDPAVAAAAGGSGDRVITRRTFIGTLAGGLLAAPASLAFAGMAWAGDSEYWVLWPWVFVRGNGGTLTPGQAADPAKTELQSMLTLLSWGRRRTCPPRRERPRAAERSFPAGEAMVASGRWPR